MASSMTWPCAALSHAELAKRTTMRVGGRVEWLLEPRDPEELRAAVVAAREQGFEPRILGGGANLLIHDGELPGVVIATELLRRVFRPLREDAGPAPNGTSGNGWAEAGVLPRVAHFDESDEPVLAAWCGASMPGLVRAAQELGWSGLEGLVGVPGCLGGGVAMNAGGRWGELWDVVQSVRVLRPDGELEDLSREQCSPTYRNGALGENIVVGAVLRLKRDRRAIVRERTKEYLLEKKRVQPVTEASCGCIFKNPDPELSDGRSAGKLIDASGCKGLEHGDAMVSPLHANFIVNRGRATAADVLALIEDVRARVAERTGVRLEREVRLWSATGS